MGRYKDCAGGLPGQQSRYPGSFWSSGEVGTMIMIGVIRDIGPKIGLMPIEAIVLLKGKREMAGFIAYKSRLPVSPGPP